MRQVSPSGKWLKSRSGYAAFLPNDLPPRLDWTPDLVRSLSDADRAIGRLAGEGHRLPNPHLLIRPFVRREAVYSSRIEGTQATLGELLAAEVGAAVDRSPEDLREVGNYVASLEYGVRRLTKLPLSLRLVRELHERLMKGVRGERAAPGQFRRIQNWIGQPGCTIQNASYVPPPPDKMMDCLNAWEGFLHEQTLPPLVQAGLMHYQFEAIHPFLDGNGRVGRLILTLFLIERAILPSPLLYLSAFFEATRSDYYDSLLAVTNQGDWNRWLTYFMTGIARQSEDALSRAERINALLADWREELSGEASKAPFMILDLIASNPYLTARGTQRKLGLSFNTVMRGIRSLEDVGILTEITGGKRDRVFCCKTLLDILDEPVRLSTT
jgi:Fic family protein